MYRLLYDGLCGFCVPNSSFIFLALKVINFLFAVKKHDYNIKYGIYIILPVRDYKKNVIKFIRFIIIISTAMF